MNNKKSPLLIIILISLVFGILGGVSGEIIARVYLFEDLYRIPLLGEINVPKNVYGGSSLVIESPRKVVVEQNVKVLETVNSVSKNIVGIYTKAKNGDLSDTATTVLDISGHYHKNDVLGQGFVVTSDGWLLSSYIPASLLPLTNLKATSTILEFKEKFIDSYVILDSEGRVYNLVDIEIDTDNQISFWRMDVKDFSVRQFAKISEIEKGQLVVATNYSGQTWLTSISDKMKADLPVLMSSDELYSELDLVHKTSQDFGNGFLFNAEGNLVALLDYGEAIIPVSSYFSCLSCLLDKQRISRPMLGLNYVDLSMFSDPATGKKSGVGALVYPDNSGKAVVADGPASEAGIIQGDIITAVNTIKVDENNNLSDIISEFAPGESISLTIVRAEKEMQISAVLKGKN